MGAVLVAGTHILQGCLADPDKSHTFVLSRMTTSSTSKVTQEVCLAAETEDDYKRWTNVLARSGQNPDQVSRRCFVSSDEASYVRTNNWGNVIVFVLVWRLSYCY